MSITLGKKSIEVEKIFSSIPSMMVYKPLKVDVNASETPKETIINIHVSIQCEYVSWWKRLKGGLVENCKFLFSKFNSNSN